MATSHASTSRATEQEHVRGAVAARVIILEYGDFACPTCKQAETALGVLLHRFGAHVQVAFRHFPLEELHPRTLIAAQAAEAAGAQGKFWEMHDLLYATQPRFESQHLLELARHLDLDGERFATELAERTHLARVRKDVRRGRRANVRGVPSFYVNGKLCDVTFGMDRLRRSVVAVLGPSSIELPTDEHHAAGPI